MGKTQSKISNLHPLLKGDCRNYIQPYSWNTGNSKRLHPVARILFITTNFPFFIPICMLEKVLTDSTQLN